MAREHKEGIGIFRVWKTRTAVLVSEGVVHNAVTMEDIALRRHWSHGMGHPVMLAP